MVRDPRQFLLLHVEKVVLVVMLILLLLVIYVYKPWSIEVPEKSEILRQLDDGKVLVDKPVWVIPEVDDYVGKTNSIIRVPWPDSQGPAVLPRSKVVFEDLKKGTIWREQDPDPPPVLPAAAVYAKADKGQVVVVFQIDDQSQRRKLEGTTVQEYQEGLEYDRIEIRRIDTSTGEKVLITPPDWHPRNLPVRYGAPASLYGTPGPTSRLRFDDPVYTFAQRRGAEDPRRMQEDLRRRMEAEMRRKMEDERRREEDLRRRLEEERARRTGEPTTPPRTRRPTTPTRRSPTVRRPTRRTRGPVVVTAPTGWYYFIDQKVDPDAQYEYEVVIFCKNPAYGSTRYSGRVVAMVQSPPAKVLADKRIASFKQWYFQGGTVSARMEMGTFKVRVFVGGRRDITMDEINAIVAELSGGKVKKTAVTPEPEGIWVEHSFTVRPGEVIGDLVSKTVGEDKRDIEFGTGCTLVSVMNDVKVVEEPYTVTRPGPDGKFQTVKLLRRVVFPQKLRIAYVDRKGNLKTRWQEVAPSLSATELPKKTDR